MFRHLLKLIWKRKSRNLMLSLEILLAFIIVFAIAAFGVRYYQMAQLPTGIDNSDVWSVTIRTTEEGQIKSDPQIYDKLKRAMLAMPEVRKVAFTQFVPYEHSAMRTHYYLPDGSNPTGVQMMLASDGVEDVSNIKLIAGTWFSPADDGNQIVPVMINQRMAAALFPGKQAVGQLLTDGLPKKADRQIMRVAGVIEDYRNQGELAPPANYALIRFSSNSKQSISTMLIKVATGTPRSFETKLNAQLRLVHSDWEFVITPLADAHASYLHTELIPLEVMGVIALFLLLMVAFGLFGVLWQSTTQRIPEIGLRRAIGANAGSIYRQIVSEQLLLSTVAMLVALLLLVQLPITGALGESLNWPVFIGATGLSMAAIYLLSLLCTLYPGWRASRLSPSEALHYE